MSEHDLKGIVRKYTLINAGKYSGTAQVGSVLSAIMGEMKELRSRAKEIKPLVEEAVKAVNTMPLDRIMAELATLGVDAEDLGPKKKDEKEGLPPLPGIDKVKSPVFRMAPFPSGPLHIGNARMVVLNDEYAKMTKGKLILAFDDTIGAMKKKIEEDDSGAKYVIPEAYDMIREGLTWLGVNWDQEVFKSDRLPIYYDYCKQLIQKGEAYACTCEPSAFKAFKDAKKPCPHRDQPIEDAMEGFQKMLDGAYEEGSAVIRFKSGVDLSDPALREPVIMRISDAEHPRVGTKYRVWPMLEFSWALDDHLLDMTYIIRGKDLFKEDVIEEQVWKIFGWKPVHILHYGIISTEKLGKLSKTYAREMITKGEYVGWDDPRTWTLQSLDRRGIRPEPLRYVLLSQGLKMADVDFPASIMYAENQKIIDPISNRYFFVEDPVPLSITGIPDRSYTAEPLVNPLDPSLGNRSISILVKDGAKKVLVSPSDVEKIKGAGGDVLVRLKDLFNVTVPGGDISKAAFHSKDLDAARSQKAPVIQWIDSDPKNNVVVQVLMPDGRVTSGRGEFNLQSVKAGETLQFERFGFVKVQSVTKKKVDAWFTH
ncbi:MAG: glutamate--tRNA ligase [Candidatus Lokiarchaeota archaeon]|nr:glutamate--tRNA ligase [Candidatus Lokiarchaeota archaeon]